MRKNMLLVLSIALFLIMVLPEYIITRISAASTLVLVVITAFYAQYAGRQANMAEQANILRVKPRVLVTQHHSSGDWPATNRYPYKIVLNFANRGNGIARLKQFQLGNEEVSYDITYKPLYLIQEQSDQVIFDIVQTKGILGDVRQAKDLSVIVHYTDELNNPYKSEATISIYFSAMGTNNAHSLMLREIVSIGEVVKNNG
ncbi:hypothetical protein [Dehalococcoides mccartyi]|jgi:hypothetical protein|uniref:hypothetical protein n=1 Tax=Dehalococcoides mccartyi TaxID=61435 RepID=UPI00098EF486|nr:hypothetical protein [Dehalococcoides mccartyi]AQU06093.1 hypothetical protein B1777_05260 [Dehalococcoides mccartyi]AQU07536.1 hypothetical protein B1778_05060 [Dehalococcoides mccartyi]QBX64059.1 hypothetical protein DhcFL2_04690 [Dehalococcoides mccartyi]